MIFYYCYLVREFLTYWSFTYPWNVILINKKDTFWQPLFYLLLNTSNPLSFSLILSLSHSLFHSISHTLPLSLSVYLPPYLYLFKSEYQFSLLLRWEVEKKRPQISLQFSVGRNLNRVGFDSELFIPKTLMLPTFWLCYFYLTFIMKQEPKLSKKYVKKLSF